MRFSRGEIELAGTMLRSHLKARDLPCVFHILRKSIYIQLILVLGNGEQCSKSVNRLAERKKECA